MAGPHAGNRNRPAYSGQPKFRFPKQIIQLFAPRKPIEFKPPPRKRKLKPMQGIAAFMDKFEEEEEAGNRQEDKEMIDKDSSTRNNPKPFETPAQRRRRKEKEKRQHVASIIDQGREAWDPKGNIVGKTKNAYTTLFVGNVAFETVERRLQQEFEQFGPVVDVFMPKDQKGLPRGYAFIEFEKEGDMKMAYREGNGMRIDGRRVLVDVERGRTVEGWYPNRLDGPHNSCVRKRRMDNRGGRSRS